MNKSEASDSMNFEELLKDSIGKNVALSYETPSGDIHTVYGTLLAVHKDFLVIKGAFTLNHVNRKTCTITELGIL